MSVCDSAISMWIRAVKYCAACLVERGTRNSDSRITEVLLYFVEIAALKFKTLVQADLNYTLKQNANPWHPYYYPPQYLAYSVFYTQK